MNSNEGIDIFEYRFIRKLRVPFQLFILRINTYKSKESENLNILSKIFLLN